MGYGYVNQPSKRGRACEQDWNLGICVIVLAAFISRKGGEPASRIGTSKAVAESHGVVGRKGGEPASRIGTKRLRLGYRPPRSSKRGRACEQDWNIVDR